MSWFPRLFHPAVALAVLFLLAGCALSEGAPVSQTPAESTPLAVSTQITHPSDQATQLPSRSATLQAALDAGKTVPLPVYQTATPTVTSSPAPAITSPTVRVPPGTGSDPACLSLPGSVEAGSLEDERLRQPLEYLVFLPPCYDQDTQRRYPSLYLIHGQSYNQDQWDRLGADEAAWTLARAGKAAPFIIVMPRDRLWGQPEEDAFGVVLVEKLLPLVDTTYRTLPDRQQRAIGGLSRGAAWAVHLGLQHWDLFGSIGAHSLPVFWSDTRKIRGWLDEIPNEEMPRIYLDIGEKDRPQILRSARWFEELLTQKGIPHEWFLFPGYHEEAYWQAHVEQYLLWYAAEWERGDIIPP